ncbi:MAG: hypothetical protein AAB401_12300 [Acidobacteriota bacterium]
MNSILVEEIAVKSAQLAIEQQRVVLNIVNSMISTNPMVNQELASAEATQMPFQSVRGILNRKLKNLEKDLAEVRREMWQNFPRDFPTTESQ